MAARQRIALQKIKFKKKERVCVEATAPEINQFEVGAKLNKFGQIIDTVQGQNPNYKILVPSSSTPL